MVSDRVYDTDVTLLSISRCRGDKCRRGHTMVSNDASFRQKVSGFFGLLLCCFPSRSKAKQREVKLISIGPSSFCAVHAVYFNKCQAYVNTSYFRARSVRQPWVTHGVLKWPGEL